MEIQPYKILSVATATGADVIISYPPARTETKSQFVYIKFETPLSIMPVDHLLYAPDGSEVRYFTGNGTTVLYRRVYSETEKSYVYREVK